MKCSLGLIPSAVLLVGVCGPARAATIPVVEDVMTSSFFTGTNLVRGYPGDARSTLRVSTDNAFGLTGAETVYLTFAASSFAGYTAPVAHARLTVESIAGGFNADGTADAPFQISAHALLADPLASIADDTNPGGAISWLDFYSNQILPASAEAITAVDSFGPVSFDVTAIVNDWISGANSVFAIALTGKHHTLNATEFLHGVRNNSDASVLGTSYLTIVPEPSVAVLGGIAGAALIAVGRRRRLIR
jgi:hypothetical protein